MVQGTTYRQGKTKEDLTQEASVCDNAALVVHREASLAGAA